MLLGRQNWPTPQSVESADTVCDISRVVFRGHTTCGCYQRRTRETSRFRERSRAAGILRIQDDEPAPQIGDAFVLELVDRRDGPGESSDLSSGFGVCLVSVFVIVRYGLSGIPRDWRTGLALCYQCVTIKMA